MPKTNTNIGWCDDSWNPVHGCFKVSEGCSNCYAAAFSNWTGNTPKAWLISNVGENVQLQRHHLEWPNALDEPRRVFVNSMSDLFLPAEMPGGDPLLPAEYIHEVMDVIEANPEHAFIALTKHGAETGDVHGETPRLIEWDREHGRWPDNLWMGVSVETARRTYRMDVLRETGAATKWISFEPLLGSVGQLDLAGIDWAVVGGESGPEDDRREMDHEWAREIRDATKEQGLPFFFKQSSAGKSEQGKRLAEAGEDLNMAALLGAGSTAYRELPALPEAMADARPDLADQVVVA